MDFFPDASFDPELVGAVFAGRYRIETEIGRGGMGTVYRALDVVEKRPVAIKTLLNADTAPEKTLRFQREYRAIARLNHPNVIQVYHTGCHQDTVFYVMELVDNYGFKTFLDFRPKSAFDFSDAELVQKLLTVFQQTCDALQYIHANRIVHRDLKPENILITLQNDHPCVKILDFGLAQDFDANDRRLTREGIPLGTVAYMSPEQAKGAVVDHRSDLYTLGIILFELLTGRLPFEAANPFTIMLNHATQPPPDPGQWCPGLPDALTPVLLKMLAKEPEQRYASALAFWQDLRGVFDDWDFPVIGASPAGEFIFGQKYPVFSPALIGREEEKLRLINFLTDETGISGRALRIEGELGAGKSRLVYELSILARLQRAPVLSSAFTAGNRAPYEAFLAIVDQARALVRSDERFQPVADQVERKIGYLRPLLEQQAAESVGIGRLIVEKKEDLLTGLGQVFGLIGQCRPVLIALEDLHWGDAGTWEIVEFLLNRLKSLPLRLLLTYRPEDIQSRPFYARLKALDEKSAPCLSLRLLDQTQIGEMLSSMLGQDLTQETSLIKRIYKQTNGNPFFVEELVKALVDNGRLYRAEDRWLLEKAPSQVTVPHSVHDAVAQRLNQLNAPQLQLLRYAAVLGKRFSYQHLHALSGLADDDLLDGLDHLLKAYLIIEQKDAWYFEFSHVLIENIVHEQTDPVWRQAQHAAAAKLLEAEHEAPQQFAIYEHPFSLELCGGLAHHYEHSQQREQAVYYLFLAAHKCLESFAFQDAEEFYERAKAVQNDLLPETWPAHVRLIRLVIDGEIAAFKKVNKTALERFEEAQKVMRQFSTGYDLVQIKKGLAKALFDEGRFDEGIQYYLEVLSLCAQLNDPLKWIGTVGTFAALGAIYFGKGLYAEALKYQQAALQEIETLQYDQLMFMLYHNLGLTYEKLGQFDQATVLMQQAYDLARSEADPKKLGHILLNLGRQKAMTGRLTEAAADFTESARIFKETEYILGEIFAQKTLGEICFEKAQLAQALKLHQDCLAQAGALNHRVLIILCRLRVLHDYLILADFKAAGEQLEQIEEAVKSLPHTPFHQETILAGVEYYLALGDYEKVAGMLKSFEAEFPEALVQNAVSQRQRLRGLAAYWRGEYGPATEHLDQAEAAFTQQQHIYMQLESAALARIIHGGENAVSGILEVFDRLFACEGFLRIALLLDAILPNESAVRLIGPDNVKGLLTRLQEEIDTTTFPGLVWKTAYFEGLFFRPNLQMRLIKWDEAIKQILKMAKVIEADERRTFFLRQRFIQNLVINLRDLKKQFNASADFKRIEAYWQKNNALPD